VLRRGSGAHVTMIFSVAVQIRAGESMYYFCPEPPAIVPVNGFRLVKVLLGSTNALSSQLISIYTQPNT